MNYRTFTSLAVKLRPSYTEASGQKGGTRYKPTKWLDQFPQMSDLLVSFIGLLVAQHMTL